MIETSPFPSLSVIIPTYNREKVLARALNGYLVQSSPGPAAARNLGIREARSALVLFTDSDIIPKRDMVEQHIEWHQRNPRITAAILGYVTWPQEPKQLLLFMRWYGEHTLFGFDRLRNKREASFHFFYTCNLSMKTEFLRTCGQFDEEFKTAAYEDIELGYRLSKKGLQLFYNSAAIGYHHQFFSFEDACRKSLGNAVATQLFFRKEAGQQLLKETQRRQPRAVYALATGLAARVARVLSPARRLLDSYLPLPGIVYRLFF